jgi:hypothetical protein
VANAALFKNDSIRWHMANMPVGTLIPRHTMTKEQAGQIVERQWRLSSGGLLVNGRFGPLC